jgi:hypothetical protein
VANGLPEYTPEEAAVFDDAFGPTVFGVKTVVPASDDPKLGKWVGGADSVVHARVATITEEKLAGKTGYTVVLSVAEPPIAGRPAEPSVELRVVFGNALTRLEGTETALVGRRLVLFLRRYDDRGEPVLHFHGEPDDPTLVAAIDRAKTLDEVAGKHNTRD